MVSMIARFLHERRLDAEKRATLRALLSMDERTLKDIGYARGPLEDALEDPSRFELPEMRGRRPALPRDAGAARKAENRASACYAPA